MKHLYTLPVNALKDTLWLVYKWKLFGGQHFFNLINYIGFVFWKSWNAVYTNVTSLIVQYYSCYLTLHYFTASYVSHIWRNLILSRVRLFLGIFEQKKKTCEKHSDYLQPIETILCDSSIYIVLKHWPVPWSYAWTNL